MGKTIDPEIGERTRDDAESLTDRRSQFCIRTGLLLFLLLALGIVVVLDPLVGPLVNGLLLGFVATLGVLVGAMALCWLGFGLFAIGDRVAAWVKRSSTWPDV